MGSRWELLLPGGQALPERFFLEVNEAYGDGFRTIKWFNRYGIYRSNHFESRISIKNLLYYSFWYNGEVVLLYFDVDGITAQGIVDIRADFFAIHFKLHELFNGFWSEKTFWQNRFLHFLFDLDVCHLVTSPLLGVCERWDS